MRDESRACDRRMLKAGGLGIACLVTFLLLPALARAAGCPNEAFRAGASAALPDCRAYELVSPPESNGRLLEAIGAFGSVLAFDIFPTELISPDGGSVAFMTYSSPLHAPGEPIGVLDIYEARRSTGGWQTTRRITPSGFQSAITTPGGVSPDHQYAFVDVQTINGTVPPLPSGSLAQANTSDYLSKPDGSFEFTAKGSLASEPYGQGRYITEGGQHIIFSTGHEGPQSVWCEAPQAECKAVQLEPDGPPEGTGGIYDRSASGPTRVISLLPGDVPQVAGQQAYYKGTSKDASSIAFEIEGTLYVRINNGEGEGEGTVKAAEGSPVFAGLSDEGRYLFYVSGGANGTIHRFDTTTKGDVAVNPTAPGEIVNISGDGSHVYFISEEEIGGEGTADEPNLFVWSGTAPEYITTVAASDLVRTSGSAIAFGLPALTRWTSHVVAPTVSDLRGPGADSSRTTPDGTVLVFESRAQLTDYENANHTEIYRYEDGTKTLECVSCGPDEPAQFDARLQELNRVEVPIVIHNLSEDGTRVFFETSEALDQGDVDGVNDIYEWRKQDDRAVLISSGHSFEVPPLAKTQYLPIPNVLLSVTPSGSDVLFLSQDTLTPTAPVSGVPSLYDARVDGGFAAPESPRLCSEDGCRPSSNAGAPSLPGPLSKLFSAGGNFKPRKHHRKRHCRARHKKRQHRRCGKAKKGARSSAAVQLQGGAGSGASALTPTEGASDGSHAGQPQTAASPVASADESFEEEFGIASVAASETTSGAGTHPDFTTRFVLNHRTAPGGQPQVGARLNSVKVALPPGLWGNPRTFPRCSTLQLLAYGNCPVESQIGIARVFVTALSGSLTEPLYNMEVPHPDEEVARLGFIGYQYPVYIDVKVRTAGDYGVTATVEGAPGLSPMVEAETILWGNPPDHSHDAQRLTAKEAACPSGTACEAPGGKRESKLPPTAFMNNPSACQDGQVGFEVTSYQLPGEIFSAQAPLAPITDCQGLPFAPNFVAEPTSHVAGATTGLRAKLVIPQQLDPAERASATMREARVTLPAGMQVAAGAANWIGTCSEAQVGYHEEVDVACPDSSKLGTATIVSPALLRPLEGNLYQRTPTPGHQFGLWLTTDDLGLHVKIPGELRPDPNTGRLTAVFADLPQVPVEEIDLNIWGGDRAPLQNPDRCGTYTTDYSFAPHSSDPEATGSSQMTIDQGCGHGFDPQLDAGVTDPTAARYSPLIVDLIRPDADQALRGFEITLPDGELAKLKGVPLCPDAAARSGACPADSAIGHLAAATGPGSEPLWVPQPGKPEPRVYLAGPYEGSPFSVVSVVPAQAGPFDLGTLVVRSGLGLDPDSNRAVIKADPLPQFFEGVGLTYRRLHVVVDRPNFALNPTDCRAMRFDSTVTSTQGAVAHPTSPFQIRGCKQLKFKPGLSLKLKGGTKRGNYPALTAVVKARKGDANIATTSVALPHSEFLAQEHIATICTRMQFAAGKCPKGSVYGKAKAWTPLLAKPLEGPVYLRSSDNPLPDLVAALGGELDVNLAGRIDSRGGGIRTTFASVPDAPITKFVLRMKGGAKSLLVNSTDVCRRKHRATVRMRAQNGRSTKSRPLLSTHCEKRSS